MRESTLPRTTPSLASMRWIVGTEKVCQLSHLPLIDVQKRAALSRLAVIMNVASPIPSRIYSYLMNYCFKHQFRGTVYQRGRHIREGRRWPLHGVLHWPADSETIL
jgi:hypothetical protein